MVASSGRNPKSLQNEALPCHLPETGRIVLVALKGAGADVPETEQDPAVVAAQKTLATNLLAARTSAGLSQDELGKRCGLGRAYIYRVEKSEANLTLASLTALATQLGLAPWQLIAPGGLEREESKVPSPPLEIRESVGDTSSPSANHLAIELPAGSAFEAARLVSTHMNRPITLVDPVTRIVSGIAGGTRKGGS